jgi:hypothetical protein
MSAFPNLMIPLTMIVVDEFRERPSEVPFSAQRFRLQFHPNSPDAQNVSGDGSWRYQQALGSLRPGGVA